jgi:hypothetical protein
MLLVLFLTLASLLSRCAKGVQKSSFCLIVRGTKFPSGKTPRHSSIAFVFESLSLYRWSDKEVIQGRLMFSTSLTARKA